MGPRRLVAADRVWTAEGRVIRYTDTRGLVDRPRTFSETVLEGMAPGGGLFVPERLPRFTEDALLGLATLSYAERATTVLEAAGLDVAGDEIARICSAAYGSAFDDERVAPVRNLGEGRFLLELWHGPTLAFKDMALQLMPRFFSEALARAGDEGAMPGTIDGGRAARDYLVLVATSGDTGAAALDGFADRERTRIVVYYPDAGVSALQERQMTTRPGGNLAVFRVDGDFDACQTAVKSVFDDAAFGEELAQGHNLALSSANSINWGRLLPQVVYYLGACAELLASGSLGSGGSLDVAVPTGNFGDILAAYYAKRMGAPIGRLLCASNANKVLVDFIETGTYDIGGRVLVRTPSPSMDILVSSNLERLLADLAGDPARIRGWMADLRESGRFTLDVVTHRRLRAEFAGDWVDNAACLQTIAEVHRERGVLLDPHTAVAWRVADRQAGTDPILVVGTAHWSKFAADVTRALEGLPPDAPMPGGPAELSLLDRVTKLAPDAAVPPRLRAVLDRPVRFRERVAGTREGVEESLRSWLASTGG